MSPLLHRIYIAAMIGVTILTTIYLAWSGYSYYSLPLEERFYHPHYDWFKPSGMYGHGLGIIGTFMIVFGVTIYILRKRFNVLSRFIRLKYLLEFHIFLCFLGPILILFHTSFKFGGLVSIAFWSMVLVVLSGIIGRFIYIQIPRTIEGRALSLEEVKERKQKLETTLHSNHQLTASTYKYLEEIRKLSSLSPLDYFRKQVYLYKISGSLKSSGIAIHDRKLLVKNIEEEVSLTQRIGRLEKMIRIFHYWHVAHLPFAIIMLVIVLIHVVVALALGYTWNI